MKLHRKSTDLGELASLMNATRLAEKQDSEMNVAKAAEKIEKGYGSGHDMKMHGEGKPYGG